MSWSCRFILSVSHGIFPWNNIGATMVLFVFVLLDWLVVALKVVMFGLCVSAKIKKHEGKKRRWSLKTTLLLVPNEQNERERPKQMLLHPKKVQSPAADVDTYNQTLGKIWLTVHRWGIRQLHVLSYVTRRHWTTINSTRTSPSPLLPFKISIPVVDIYYYYRVNTIVNGHARWEVFHFNLFWISYLS